MCETAVVTVASYPRYAGHRAYMDFHTTLLTSDIGIPPDQLKTAKDTIRGTRLIDFALAAGSERMPVVIVDKDTHPDLMDQARRAYLFTDANPRHWIHVREPSYVKSRARARYIGLHALHASGIPFKGSLMIEPEKGDMIHNAIPAIHQWIQEGKKAGVLGRFVDEFKLKYPPLQYATETAMNVIVNALLRHRMLISGPDIDWLSGSRWNSREVTAALLRMEPVHTKQMDYAWYLFFPYFRLLERGKPVGITRTKQHYTLLQDEMERRESSGAFLQYRLHQALPILQDVFDYFGVSQRTRKFFIWCFFSMVTASPDVKTAIGSDGMKRVREYQRLSLRPDRHDIATMGSSL